MEVTPIGWILLPLGIVLCWASPQLLYVLMVFFLPFSATAAVNIGSADSASGLQASMLFGSLWILTELSTVFHYSRFPRLQQLRTPVRQLFLFVVIAGVSLIVPLWISGHVVIESSELGDSGSIPLQLTGNHISQLGYLVYGILLAILIAFRNSEAKEFVRSVKIFLISATFVSLWGFLQFTCWALNLDYPSFIFNTSKTESALGYTQQIRDIGLTRISSVATEPSMFAQVMLVAAVIALFTVISSQPLFSKARDRLILAIILGGLLLSTSTTAYLGLVLVALLYGAALVHLKVLRSKYVIPLLLFLGALLVAGAFYSPVRDIYESMILGKGDSYSALVRINSVLLARDYFLQFPVLGLGWGSVTSHDLVFKLLSNTGVVGFLVFVLFLITLMKRIWRTARSNKDISVNAIWWPGCFSAVLVTLIFTNIFGGFAFTYGHVWFVFGLVIAVPALNPLQDSTPHNFDLRPRTVE